MNNQNAYLISWVAAFNEGDRSLIDQFRFSKRSKSETANAAAKIEDSKTEM